MKPRYLGDAKDFAKGFILSWLRENDFIRGIVVLPFFTCSDHELKDDSVIKTYSSILGVNPDCVLSLQTWPCVAKQRTSYLDVAFQNVGVANIAFLDPDTGVRPELYGKSRTSKNKYIVTFEDVLRLLEVDHSMIAIVYDESYSHADRKYLREAVQDKLNDLLAIGCEKKISGFAYVGMALNLLFIGNEKAKREVSKIAEDLSRLLDGAEQRVIRPVQMEQL